MAAPKGWAGCGRRKHKHPEHSRRPAVQAYMRRALVGQARGRRHGIDEHVWVKWHGRPGACGVGCGGGDGDSQGTLGLEATRI